MAISQKILLLHEQLVKCLTTLIAYLTVTLLEIRNEIKEMDILTEF